MLRSKKSLDERLVAAQVAVTNVLADNEIKKYLAEFGYDETRLSEGKMLLDRVNQLQQAQLKEYGDQYQATGALQELMDKADREYMRSVKVARIALRQDYALYHKLDLDGLRKKTFSGWLTQARQFYINALGDEPYWKNWQNSVLQNRDWNRARRCSNRPKPPTPPRKRKKAKPSSPPWNGIPQWTGWKSGSATLSPSPASPWKRNRSCWKSWALWCRRKRIQYNRPGDNPGAQVGAPYVHGAAY